MSQDQSSTSSANSRQVGGAHYKDATGRCPTCGGELQHWDLFAKMPYLVGQVCKYVLRFQGKNGRQDLDKARHFLDKLIEVYYGTPLEKKQAGTGCTVEVPTPVVEVQPNHQPYTSIPIVAPTSLSPTDEEKLAASRRRAEAFAQRSTASRVPEGWILEETSLKGYWHYREANGGQWSEPYPSYETAFNHLIIDASYKQ